jgi:hypothetical protein
MEGVGGGEGRGKGALCGGTELQTQVRTEAGRGRQGAGLRLLHKTDPVGAGPGPAGAVGAAAAPWAGYAAAGFGPQCVPQMLALALYVHEAARGLSATGPVPGPGRRRAWLARVGIARGSVAAGQLGAARRRCHLFGGPAAEAARLAAAAAPGATLLQRGLARAEGAQAFLFEALPGGLAAEGRGGGVSPARRDGQGAAGGHGKGEAGPLLLVGRRAGALLPGAPLPCPSTVRRPHRQAEPKPVQAGSRRADSPGKARDPTS